MTFRKSSFRLVPAILALVISAGAHSQPAGVATYVGEAVCTQCHATTNEHFAHTSHAKRFRLNPRSEREARVCEACHGPGSLHRQDPTDRTALIGFTKRWGTPVDVMNGQCL